MDRNFILVPYEKITDPLNFWNGIIIRIYEYVKLCHFVREEMIKFLTALEQEVRVYMFKGQFWLENLNKIA